jgi:hypothetical protein
VTPSIPLAGISRQAAFGEMQNAERQELGGLQTVCLGEKIGICDWEKHPSDTSDASLRGTHRIGSIVMRRRLFPRTTINLKRRET